MKGTTVSTTGQPGGRRLFGTSGVRGVIGKELTQIRLLELGQAIATSLPVHSKVIVGNDTRTSRNFVKENLTKGLLNCGIDVIDAGTLPTPILAFAARDIQADAGIMITASHNPPEYNGFKLFNSDGTGYSQAQEREIERLYSDKTFRTGGVSSLVHNTEVKQHYFAFMKKTFGNRHPARRFKVLVDTGNGAAAGVAPELFSLFGFDIIPLNDFPDGNFPGRNPEPRPDTVINTMKSLLKYRADIGVCFDGDADRVVFLDKNGFISFNQAIAFISALAVESSGKKRVAATMETGMLLEYVLGNDVSIFRGKVGDVHVARLARETDAAIGVEPVGVYILPEIGFYPDSLAAVLKLLLSVSKISDIRERNARLPRFFSKQVRVPCPEGDKPVLMNEILHNIKLLGNGIFNMTDGLRIDFDHSWILVRPSGTEPILRIIVESTVEDETEKLLEHAFEIVQQLGQK